MIQTSFKSFFRQTCLLTEGGNLFSTRRINQQEVEPTLKRLEKPTRLPLVNNTLGSTGKAETSGDIDVVVNSNNCSIDELIERLRKNGLIETDEKSGKDTNIKKMKIGIEIAAFQSPIIGTDGNETGDYIQVDFMFHDDPDYLKFAYASNETLPYFKGKHRNIMISSIAKEKNLSFSMKGLRDRTTNTVITRDPDMIAQIVLGERATERDLLNIPALVSYLKREYSEEEVLRLVADAEKTIKEEIGVSLYDLFKKQ